MSNFNVTPSKAIDTVWHEHLLFTKAYREFCDDVIHYNFEHHPELIALDEQTENFAVQYVKTLQLYRYEFGYDAPPSIWDLPKFSREQLKSVVQLYKEKPQKNASVYADGIAVGNDNDAPLISFFETAEFSEFGGGDFGGGGAGGDFSDGADASGSDSSSSSCSSGCSSCGGGD